MTLSLLCVYLSDVGSATPQTASSGKFRVVRDNISKQHVELVHTVNR